MKHSFISVSLISSTNEVPKSWVKSSLCNGGGTSNQKCGIAYFTTNGAYDYNRKNMIDSDCFMDNASEMKVICEVEIPGCSRYAITIIMNPSKFQNFPCRTIREDCLFDQKKCIKQLLLQKS